MMAFDNDLFGGSVEEPPFLKGRWVKRELKVKDFEFSRVRIVMVTDM